MKEGAHLAEDETETPKDWATGARLDRINKEDGDLLSNYSF